MLVKQAIDVSFAQGLDTKTDPKRVQMGKFVRLENSIFDKGGLLQKRNGYGRLTSLPDTTYSYLTTFTDNLTAVGTNIAAYNSGGSSWVTKGHLQPLSLETLPVIRNNLNQSAQDICVAPNGVACVAYLETDGTTTTNKYAVFDSVTGQNIVAPTAIPVSSGAVSGGMRVFYLGSNFIIVFTNVITAVSHLQYIAVNSLTPTVVTANADIASAYISATTLSWDGYVVGNNLYIAYNNTSGGQSVKVTYLNTSFIVATPINYAALRASIMSVCADVTDPVNPIIYVSPYSSATGNLFTFGVDSNLNVVYTATNTASDGGNAFLNVATAAQNGVCYAYYEVTNNYAWDSSIPTHYIGSVTYTAGTGGTPAVSCRSIGLASKAFIVDSVIYYMGIYQSPYQPTYFLINATTSLSSAPVIAAKLAYQNGGGYLTKGLPSVTVTDDTAQIGYLVKDLITAVNKNTAVPAGTQVNGIYSQTGINMVSFTLGTEFLNSVEIGSDLHLTGGFLWMYDGYLPVEHSFFLYPDSDQTTPADTAAWAATGGSIAAKPDGATNTNAYYYVSTYEWTDNQGNAFRSAPSIPIAVTTTGAGTSGSVTVNVPTLRLTMKTANKVKIVIYRWSVAQPVYYQVTSITSPLLNDTTADTVQFVDTSADATILGNNLLYTTGGVAENIAAPATNVLTLFDSRLWLIDAEDPNLLWFSKQVIESTPVELTDLFTIFVPPTTGTQTSTGPLRTSFVMDDKLILGKDNALLYINGAGPDNTGANNQYSQATFITSTVGCANQRSWALTPQGLMFESNKGIWILGRNLETSYIGAPVQDLTTGATVLSAVVVPETNQVRFILDSGVTLMYDYFYNQWGTFVNVPALSSCIFDDLHTFINSSGAVYQETPSEYLDGSRPVLMAFKTGPLRLGELQNYQRAYFFYILGQFISPHKLVVSLAYDYATEPSQQVVITPTNYSTAYGSGASQSPYGEGSPYGGNSSLELWRVFLERQRCMAFSIELQEIFDSSYGVAAGAGLTISGLNVVCAFKKAFRPQEAAASVG